MKKILFFLLFVFIFLSIKTVSAQNYGLTFTNQNAYAQVPVDPTLELTGPLTLEAWIYPTAWKTNVYEGCILNKEGLNYQGYMLRCGANGTLNFNIGTGTAWKELSSASGTLVLNTWQHIAGVYDGTVLKIYVNGVQVGSTLAYTGAVATNTAIPLEIGRSNYYPTRNYLGRVDEVRIWNAAVSSCDIYANYKSTITPSHPNYANLVAYYEMDNYNTDTDTDGNFDLVASVGPSGEVFTAPYNLADNSLFIGSAPIGSTSIEAYQSTTAPASLGGTNQHILKIAIEAFADVSLSQMVFQTNGTTSTSDILNARVWYTGSNPNFSPTTQFGTTIPAPPGANNNMTFTGTQTVSCGRSYLWLTYDIDPNATLTNLVDATFLNATIDGATLLPTTSDPIGAREIAATCTHTLRITDTYGDGWNGGLVNVLLNGSPILTAIGLPSGYGPVDYPFIAGTGDAISVVLNTAGSYPSEMRVQLLDGNGVSILNAIQPTTSGVNALGYCGGFATTTSATLITAFSAQLNGSYANCVPSESGFRYKKTSETIWNFVQDYNNPMTYDLQGLDPATNYHYQAYAIVGADTLWGATINFATACVPFTIPFAESFNSTTIPLCWTNSTSNAFNFVTSGTSPTVTPFFGSGMARFGGYYSYTSGSIGYLVTPPIANLTTGMEVRFWFYRQDLNNTYTVGAIRVKANSTNNPTNAVLLTTVQRVYNQAPVVPAAGWYEYVAVIPADTFTHIIFECTSDYYANMYLDEVTIDYPATCPRPPATSVTVPVVLNNSATINWLRGGLETEWEVAYKTSAETTWTTETAYDTLHTIYNLTSATTYQVKVRAVCAPGDESLWTLEKTFTTMCDPISTLPIIENCETTPSNELPLCFSKIVSGNATVYVESYSSNKVVRLTPGATTNKCFLLLPALTEPVNNIRVQFKYIGGDNHIFKIGYFSDPTDTASFVQIYNPSISGSGTWKTFDIVTTNTMTGSEIIAIGLVMPSGSYVYLDSITISLQPQCIEPISLTVDNSNLNDITLSWLTLAPTSNLEYKESTTSTWTTLAGVTSPYTISGLTQNTAYNFRVQAVCDGGVLSAFTSTITYSTLCEIITVLPYVQDFESTPIDAIPSCYNKIQSGGGTVKVIDITAEQPLAGKVLQMDFGSSSSGNAYIILPKFDFPVNTLRIGFKYYGGTDNHRIGYITDPTDPATFTEILNVNIQTNSGWNYFDLLTNNTLTGNERIAIKYNPQLTWHNNRYDSLTVMLMPSCLPPFALTATNVQTNQATLNWTQPSVGTAVDYNIEYKTSTETTWTLISNVTFPYNLTTLLPITTYQFRVQANCSATEMSDFSMPVSFTTLCAPLTPPTVSEPFAAMLPNTCWDRKNGDLPATGNATLTSSTVGWYIRTTLGQNTAAVNQYGSSCKYWLITPSVDLGDGSTQYQLDFDLAITDYYNANAGNTAQSPNARFVVLISTDNGTTWNSTGRLKEWNNTTGTPFSSLNNTLQSQSIPIYDSVAMAPYSGIVKFAFFVYESDATGNYDNDLHIDNFQVNPYNTCSRPTGISATNVGSYSAQINWTETGTANSWVIEYGAPGFTLGTGTSVIASTNPFVISSLSPLTAYQYYVKADCGAGNTSNWSLPGTFTTLPSCPAPTVLLTSNVTTTSLDLAWTENGTAQDWEIQYGVAGFTIGNGTSLYPVTNPQTINTLTPATTYDFYVRSICGVGDTSAWSTKKTISTPCLPSTLPFVENFTGASIPVCWSQTFSGALTSNRWSISTGSNAGGTPNQMNCAYQNAIGISRLIAPAIDFTGVTNPVLTFKYMYDDYGAGVTLKIQTSTDLTNWTDQPFTIIGGTGDVGPLTASVNLTLGTGVNYIAWVVDGNHFQINNWYVDDVTITSPTLTCASPTNLSISAITQTQASATWTAGGTETQWELAYKSTASTTWTSVLVNSTPSQLISSLTAATAYDVKVRAICAPGDTSTWTSVVNFTTASVATCNPPTGLSVTNNGNGSVNINWINGGSENEWEVDYKEASSSTWTTILVTSHPYLLMGLTPCSDYNVRVRAICSAGLYSSYSTTVNITIPAITPTNLQVLPASISDQSAIATWTPSGPETQWQVEYKLVSSSNWTSATVNLPQHLMAGLQSNSNYEVRVKAICSATNESSFTTSVPFTTTGGQVTYTITATAGANGTITPSGVVTVNQGASQTFNFAPSTGYIVSVVSVDGSPITGAPTSYTFTNVNANRTIHVDFISGISENELAQLVELFPNPTSSTIELRLKSEDLHVKECKIYDMYGKLMKTFPINAETTSIDVTDFASGVYFVRMDSERGTISKKFVKK